LMIRIATMRGRKLSVFLTFTSKCFAGGSKPPAFSCLPLTYD
jgi:hypothetical protein